MDNNQKKIMPGCEKLTKPEEISALREYLKQGIQEKEESLVTGDENPVLKTPGEPILAEKHISEKKIRLVDDRTIELNKGKVSLDVSHELKLSEEVDLMPGKVEDAKPSESLVNLAINQKKEELPDSVVELKDKRTLELSEKKFEISENKIQPKKSLLELAIENDVQLNDDSLQLNIGERVNPKETLVNLQGPEKITSLSEYLEKLAVTNDVDLPDDKVFLHPGTEVKPEKEITNLSIGESVKPEEKKLTIDAPFIKPEEKKLEIEEKEVELPENKQYIFENLTEPSEKILKIENEEIDPSEKLIKIGENEVIPVRKRLLMSPDSEDITSFKEGYSRNWLGDNLDNDSSNEITKEELAETQKLDNIPSNVDSGTDIKFWGDHKKQWIGDNIAHIREDGTIINGSDRIEKNELKKTQKTLDLPENDSKSSWLGDNNSEVISESSIEDYSAPLFDLIQQPNETEKISLGGEGEKDYLNLDSVQYETYVKIKNTVEQLNGTPSANWAKRLLSYLQAVLSRTEGWRKKISDADFEGLKALLENKINVKVNTILPEDAASTGDITKRSTHNGGNYERDWLGDNHGDSGEEITKDDLPDKKITRPKHHSANETAVNNIINADGVLDTVRAVGNSSISLSGSLRSVAELTADLTGKLIKDSSIKQDVLDSVLYGLVQARDALKRTMSSSPNRLPGNSGLGGTLGNLLLGNGSLADRAKSAIGTALDSGSRQSPLNRPKYDAGKGRTDQKLWNNGTGDITFATDYLGKLIEKEDREDYFRFINDGLFDETRDTQFSTEFSGIRTTLEDLCPIDQNGAMSSLEDLKELLSKSPYITTADKVNKGRSMTLDSNHVWELRLFPYLGHLNGNCSWLPNIAEINSINYIDHGVRTTWCDWIPVNSFELQSRKMIQKTLGLYDGEISFPVSMEFTNELRISLIDDQYKSWKRYFELCSECSTYLTKMMNYEGNNVSCLNTTGSVIGGNTKDYTQLTGDDLLNYSDTTPIVKGVVCPGMYKNLAFRCLIYVMTPQMSTIQKFDLLLVLKDYSIEYMGEPDSSSPDLTLSFSVVGENPDYNLNINTGTFTPKETKSKEELKAERKAQRKENRKKNAVSTLKNAVNSSINLLT